MPSRTTLSTDLPTPATGGPLIRHLDGAAVAAAPGRWVTAYERVYADALGLSDHADPPFRVRLLAHTTRPGFELVAGLDGDRVAGFVYGYALPPDTLWWEGLHPDPGPEFTREHPGRTVGVCELLVTPAWRRSRLGHTLVETFLRGRGEERAAGFVAADNEIVLAAYARYGFASVGRTRPHPGWRPHVAVVRSLRR